MMSSQDESIFEVTRYDGTEMTATTVTRHELRSVDPQSVDHYVCPARASFEFRTATREWIVHDWSGLGPRSTAILQVLQEHPGEYLVPIEIARLSGYQSFIENNNLSARLRSLRLVHRETARTPWFFHTHRNGGFTLAWSADRTWMRVEKIFARTMVPPDNPGATGV